MVYTNGLLSQAKVGRPIGRLFQYPVQLDERGGPEFGPNASVLYKRNDILRDIMD